MEPLIEFRHVAKHFSKNGRRLAALGDVDLSVMPGEFVAIVGPSGCGKSTLLNLAAGLMQPSAGTIHYAGQQVDSVSSRVGYVTQKDNLLPWRTVTSNIALALEIRGMPKKVQQSLVDRHVELVGLKGFEHHYPGELSGGMRKRVALARTLIYDPETLLMDEPFGALDAQLKLILQDELLKLWEKTSKTIVFVTHDLAEAVTLADRVAVISARPGRLKLVQTIDLARPRNVFQLRFTEAFGELHALLWKAMQDDIRKGEDV